MRAPAAPRERIVTGAIDGAPPGSLQTLRVPWAIAFRRYSANLLAHVLAEQEVVRAVRHRPRRS